MNQKMKLSKNFYQSEFTASRVANENGIKNIPGEKEVENLEKLCEYVLQPIRDYLGIPISVSSGYRNEVLNALVGGVESSQHVKGEAADIYSTKMTARNLFNEIIDMNIEFDQIILYPTFVHISFKEGHNRNQILYAKGVKP